MFGETTAYFDPGNYYYVTWTPRSRTPEADFSTADWRADEHRLMENGKLLAGFHRSR